MWLRAWNTIKFFQAWQVESDMPIHADIMREPNWEVALRISEHLQYCGAEPQVIAYATAACSRAKLWMQTLAYYAVFLHVCPQPQLLPATSAAAAWQQGTHWSYALCMLNVMSALQLERDRFTLQTSAASHCCGQQWERAFAVTCSVFTQNMRPNSDALRMSFRAAHNGITWEQALSTCNWMDYLGVRPDRNTHLTSISVCQREAHWQPAIKLLLDSQKARIQTGISLMAPAIGACRACKQWVQALILASQKWFLITDVALTNLMASCEDAGHWDMALAVLRSMKQACPRMQAVLVFCNQWEDTIMSRARRAAQQRRGRASKVRRSCRTTTNTGAAMRTGGKCGSLLALKFSNTACRSPHAQRDPGVYCAMRAY